MKHADDMLEALGRWATTQPDRAALVFLDGQGTERMRLTYGALHAAARRFGYALAERVSPGGRVVLSLEDPAEFIVAFFGVMEAGATAVPVNLPSRRDRLEKILAILADSGAELVIASTPAEAPLEVPGSGGTRAVPVCVFESIDAPEGSASGRARREIAFLQYTSGSTGQPKGVVVAHSSLMANMRMLAEAFESTPDRDWVSWLPHFHDMGLVGGILHPLYAGSTSVLMTPRTFVQNPLLWLTTIARYRGTVSGAPNFAYDLCARRFEGRDLGDLDLSSWRVAFNGAEPVRNGTLERFAATFAPYGFDPRASYPCYGLAEATLFVTGGPPGREIPVESPSVPTGASDVRQLVGCGRAWGGLELRIVDPETQMPCLDGAVGEIWLRGGSVCHGYFGAPEATQAIFGAHTREGEGREGPYLRTGDLGYRRGHELFVTGRRKDLIVLNGRNIHPQDVERATSLCHEAFVGRPGAAVAIDGAASERLVVLQEVNRGFVRANDVDALRARIVAAIGAELGVVAHDLVLLRPGALPMTTSGKVRRAESRSRFVRGELEALRVDLPGAEA